MVEECYELFVEMRYSQLHNQYSIAGNDRRDCYFLPSVLCLPGATAASPVPCTRAICTLYKCDLRQRQNGSRSSFVLLCHQHSPFLFILAGTLPHYGGYISLIDPRGYIEQILLQFARIGPGSSQRSPLRDVLFKHITYMLYREKLADLLNRNVRNCRTRHFKNSCGLDRSVNFMAACGPPLFLWFTHLEDDVSQY